ncbi:hypothetical protein [Vibrio agarivorans]|uniref:hypothetical protein n=1 Tax=Vibrio agarivorans TaxID=153622 RepID=UPI0025B36827|nr:hypothetical protein [Vibrio agarivorans]MDN3659959.1 hypothetical protein [Vibrio agarivorans]
MKDIFAMSDDEFEAAKPKDLMKLEVAIREASEDEDEVVVEPWSVTQEFNTLTLEDQAKFGEALGVEKSDDVYAVVEEMDNNERKHLLKQLLQKRLEMLG